MTPLARDVSQGEGGEQCDSLMPAFCALAQFDALDLQHQLRDNGAVFMRFRFPQRRPT